MIKPRITIIIATIGLSLSAWATAEEKVSLEKIPSAAAKALKDQAGSDKITNVSKEKDEGKTAYEATFTRKGRVHDVTVSEDGKLISDEEVIPASEAPGAVRAAIEKAAPGGKIEKLERIKEGRKVSYEALIS